jgi:hypothetical protein
MVLGLSLHSARTRRSARQIPACRTKAAQSPRQPHQTRKTRRIGPRCREGAAQAHTAAEEGRGARGGTALSGGDDNPTVAATRRSSRSAETRRLAASRRARGTTSSRLAGNAAALSATAGRDQQKQVDWLRARRARSASTARPSQSTRRRGCARGLGFRGGNDCSPSRYKRCREKPCAGPA